MPGGSRSDPIERARALREAEQAWISTAEHSRRTEITKAARSRAGMAQSLAHDTS